MRLRFRELREDRDLTQAEIAFYLNLNRNSYSMYERGRRGMPIECWILLARYYDVDMNYIMGLTAMPRPFPK